MRSKAGFSTARNSRSFAIFPVSKLPLSSASISLFALTGCAAIQVHLGTRVRLDKIPVTSIDVRQDKAPGIGPEQKSSLIVTLTAASGRTYQTEGAGGGKVMWRDLVVSPSIVTVNKKGVISLPYDPRPSDGKLPHVAVTVPSQPSLHAELDIPLRYDYKFNADFSGSDGSNGTNGSDGHDGASGTPGSMDPNSPSAGGNGSDGTNGSDGMNGQPGNDAAPVEIRMTVEAGTHPLLQFAVSAAGHERYYLVDPQGGSLFVRADGGSGGQGGKGGRAGRGGSGGIGTPNGSSGHDGSSGSDGMNGSNGRGGKITVTYDPSAKPFLETLRLSSRGGPRPTFQEEPVAPLW